MGRPFMGEAVTSVLRLERVAKKAGDRMDSDTRARMKR
jgi:hypothetical protein